MFRCGRETELITLLLTTFGVLVLQIDWTMRSLLLENPDLEMSARRSPRSSLDGRKQCYEALIVWYSR